VEQEQQVSPSIAPNACPDELTVADNEVPVGISARHIHLSQAEIDKLFGKGYKLQKYRRLYQEKEFAAKETLTVVGPKGVLENVRIIGPSRQSTQIEVSRTDAFKLGITVPIRDSGDIAETPGCVLIGPKDVLSLKQGVIIPKAHVHMHPKDAKQLKLKEKDRVQVAVCSERPVTFNDVLIRIDPAVKLEMHLDTDEANAAFVENGKNAFIIPQPLLS